MNFNIYLNEYDANRNYVYTSILIANLVKSFNNHQYFKGLNLTKLSDSHLKNS